MSEHKNNFELAAEITIAAVSTNGDCINHPEVISDFYRAIYKEIATCEDTPLVDLR